MAIKASNQVSLTDVTDAYSVTLTSEAYVFMGDNESGAPSGLSCTTQVIAYRGSQQCTNINVGKIQCPTGISAKIENNGTSVPTITFTTTAAITDSCEATIPVTVGDVSFTKIFSFAIATSVDDATLELYLKKDETGTLKSMIEAIADVINITSKGGLNLSGDRFTLDSTNTKISADGTITTKSTLSSGNTITAELKGGGLKFYTTETTNHVWLEGHGLFIVNDNGNTIASLAYSSTGGNLELINVNTGKRTAWLGTANEGHGFMQTVNNKGVPVCELGSRDNSGILKLWSSTGKQRVSLNAMDNRGDLVLLSSADKQVVDLSANSGGSGQLILRSSFGNDAIRLYSYENGINSGYLEILNSGKRIILLDGANGNINAHGSLSVNGGVNGRYIELSFSTPYIDFHYNRSKADYTSRLIEEVSGSIYLRIPGGNGWFHAAGYAIDSSKHVKTNIKDITDEEALKLLDLRTVSFDYKNGQTNKRGMIAEEVMDVYPELVQVPDGYDEDTFEYDEKGNNIVPSLDYAGFVPYLIKMVQIQQKEIEDLKEQVSELSKKLV